MRPVSPCRRSAGIPPGASIPPVSRSGFGRQSPPVFATPTAGGNTQPRWPICRVVSTVSLSAHAVAGDPTRTPPALQLVNGSTRENVHSLCRHEMPRVISPILTGW
jgi:hypothetical protein